MEETKSKNKKKKSGLMIALAVLLVAIIGGTYAWLTLTLRGTKTNVIRAGNLSLQLDDTATEGIKMNDAYPMTDEEGEATTAYTFTLSNDGTIASNYTIYLDDLAEVLKEGSETEKEEIKDENRIADEFIKYSFSFVKGESGGVAPTADLLNTLVGSNEGKRVLDTGTIQPGDEYSYTLKLWIDESATNDDITYTDENGASKGKIFAAQLRVEAEQAPHVQTAGLYDNTNKLTTSWDELISGDYLVVNEGALSAGANVTTLSGKLVIPETVTTIAASTFNGNTGLTRVTLPNAVTSIGENAFAGCTDLTTIEWKKVAYTEKAAFNTALSDAGVATTSVWS